jgi:hypothetical protein
VLDHIESEHAPAHLLLGSSSLQAVDVARAAFDAGRATFEPVTRSTDDPI